MEGSDVTASENGDVAKQIDEAVVTEEGVECDEVLRNFIETYESMPELWNSSLDSYMNKTKRNAGLMKLLQIYKQIKPAAKVADVRRKINTLRSNYRKELKKIVASKRSGAGADDVYEPTSWVFHALKFLFHCEQPITTNSELNKSEGDDEAGGVENNSENQSQETQVSSQSMLPSSSILAIPPPKRQRKMGPISKQNELLSAACKLLQQEPTKCSTKQPLPIATVWSEKLEALDSHQRLYAEKAINDILFEASLGNLNRYSVKINEYVLTPQPLVSPSGASSSTTSTTYRTESEHHTQVDNDIVRFYSTFTFTDL